MAKPPKSSMMALSAALAPAKEKKTEGDAPEVQKEGAAHAGEKVLATEEAGTKVLEDADNTKGAPAAPAEPPKEEKGPVKITTNGQLLKALWSSRGNVFFATDTFPVPLAVVKKEMTEFLKTKSDLNGPAPFDLVPRADNTGSDLIARPEYAEFLKNQAAS
jgi:hypothetical protein